MIFCPASTQHFSRGLIVPRGAPTGWMAAFFDQNRKLLAPTMRHIIQCTIIACFCTIQVIYSLTTGDLCVDPRTKKTGFCKPILKCPEAITDIKRGTFPLTCGFLSVNPDPIICCLYDQNSTSQQISTTTRKEGIIFGDHEPTTITTVLPIDEEGNSTEEKISFKKCKEYSNFVYENRTSPVLLIGYYVTVDTCIKNAPFLTRKGFTAPREYPHSALIGYKYLKTVQWKCGGTLLSERYVLTSAECTYSDMYGFARYVRVGVSDFSDKTRQAHLQDIDVLEIVRHPNYVEGTSQNDIALLKLETPAKLSSFVRPVCLPLSKKLAFKQVLISGWGTVNFTENNDFVLKQQLLSVKSCCSPGVRGEKCNKNQFCVEPLDEYMCVADKGGSALIYHPDVYCSYTAVGVISSWDSCSSFSEKSPVFVRLSKYIDWIESNIWS